MLMCTVYALPGLLSGGSWLTSPAWRFSHPVPKQRPSTLARAAPRAAGSALQHSDHPPGAACPLLRFGWCSHTRSAQKQDTPEPQLDSDFNLFFLIALEHFNLILSIGSPLEMFWSGVSYLLMSKMDSWIKCIITKVDLFWHFIRDVS